MTGPTCHGAPECRLTGDDGGVRTPWLVLLLLLAAVVGAPAAAAHEADPRIFTTIEAVVPALPDEVVVQAQAGIATQLVASNPTPTVLEVIGTEGRPFLRISSAGVLADVGGEEFFTTSNPNGGAPSTAGGPPRWVQISEGSSWGWYDHRLHPQAVRAPADAQRAATLAEVAVPLRYGEQEVTVRGTVRFQPMLGSYVVSADPAPQSLTADVLPGRLPGIFLSAPPDRDVVVLGRDGEPFLRISDAGVEVNVRSRTHVEDRQARGEQAGPPSTTPDYELVAPGERSYTWLDTRLRAPADLPAGEVLLAGEPTVVEEWEVPLEVDAQPARLTGDVTWVPEPDAAAQVASSAAPVERERLVWPYVLGSVVLVVGLAALALRRRTSR